MGDKGLLVLGGLLAGLWAWNNPDKVNWLLEQVEKSQQLQRQRLALQAPPPAVPPPPVTLPPPPRPALDDYGLGELIANLKLSSADTAVPVPAYTPPVDEALARLLRHPAVILILGHRGSGKSALAVRLQELLRDVAPPYAIGLPSRASRLLPDWYGLADDPGLITQNAIIYFPESYRLFHSRSTQSAQGQAVSDLVNLSRHRRHTLIFDVQNAAHLDRNIISEADVVLVKQPGPLQQAFERSQLAPIMDSARAAFASVTPAKRKSSVWVFAPNAGSEGKLMQNELASFWSDRLSTIFGETAVSLGVSGQSGPVTEGQRLASNTKTAPPRRGLKTPTDTKREKARKMAVAGYSQRGIAKTLGISPSYVNKLLKDTRRHADLPSRYSKICRTTSIMWLGVPWGIGLGRNSDRASTRALRALESSLTLSYRPVA